MVLSLSHCTQAHGDKLEVLDRLPAEVSNMKVCFHILSLTLCKGGSFGGGLFSADFSPFLLVNRLFKMMNWAEMLSSVPKNKKAVRCLMEKYMC